MGNDGQRREVLEHLADSLPVASRWQKRIDALLQSDRVDVGVHLAIFIEPFLTAVIEGKKTIESRFAVTRRPPYNCIEPNDIILIKKSGGPVTGVAVARSIDFYRLSPAVLRNLRRRFARQLFATDDGFWTERAGKLYATLIELEDPIAIEPFNVQKRDRQGWVTYERRSGRNVSQLGL